MPVSHSNGSQSFSRGHTPNPQTDDEKILQPREVAQSPEIHGLLPLEAHHESKYTAKDEPILLHNYDIRPSVRLHFSRPDFQNLWWWWNLPLWEDVRGRIMTPFPAYSSRVTELPWGCPKPDPAEWMEVLLCFVSFVPNIPGGVSDVCTGIFQHLPSYCLQWWGSGLPCSPELDLHLITWQLFQQQEMAQWVFLCFWRMGVSVYRTPSYWSTDTQRMVNSWEWL